MNHYLVCSTFYRDLTKIHILKKGNKNSYKISYITEDFTALDNS